MWCHFYLVVLCSTLVLHSQVNGLTYVGCDYENDVDPLCSFYMDSTNDFDWKLDTADPHTSVTRPTADHTYANKSGHYVYIESAFQTEGGGVKKSRLMSPTVLTQRGRNDTHLCLEFNYHMYGPPSQNLHVFLREHGQNIPQYSHWNRSGNLGDVWHQETLTIPADSGFQIIFEGTKGTDFHGDISLDDIIISEGRCAQGPVVTPTSPSVAAPTPVNQFECDLDSSMCGFTNEQRNTFHWIWRATSSRPPFGPLGDHTSGSAAGAYLFVPKDSANQRQEQRSRISTPLFSVNSVHKCLRFYHYMKGNNVGTLNAYILQDNMTLPLIPNWTKNTSQGNVWQYGYIDIKPQSTNYQIVFEAVRGRGYDGSIAIDDIVLSNDLCPVVNVTCDFEKGLGTFIQDTTDDRNWNLNSRTPSWYTGPDKDHTYLNSLGHFVYLETSGRKTRGHVARLISPRIFNTVEIPRCLQFWYHMWGDDIEALNVYITNTTVTDKHTAVWTRSGNRGNKWRAAEVHLNSSVDFQVVFEAEQGPGYRGDIAIDDITILADVCSGEHHYHNYSKISCDFEEAELCYYTQDLSDDFDWHWTNGDQVPSIDDHTTQNELGFYLLLTFGNPYIHWYVGYKQSVARISSPYAAPQKLPSCLVFWYYIYGRDTEELKVYIQKANEELPTDPEWTKSGDQGDVWHRGTIDINVINARFRIVFEGVTGSTYRDDIAIDDVTFYNSSSCPVFTTEPSPPVTLPPTRVNASCNFEEHTCNYTQISLRDEMDWSRRNGNRYDRYWWSYSFTGPKRDHTLNTGQGNYMNFDCGGWWQPYDSRAQLATPYLASHSAPMCLKFYYYMYGYGVDFLNVYIVPFGYTLSIDSQLAIYGNKGTKWHLGTLELPASTSPYRIIFEGRKGHYSSCDIAIDDITFANGACPTDTPDSAPSSAGSCDFEPSEDQACGYEQDNTYHTTDVWGFSMKADNFDWILNKGNTTTINTGPRTDHTTRTQNGYYYFVESSLPRRPREVARLASPVIDGSTEPMCVQFYYHMKGTGIGNLRLIWRAENVDEKVVMTMSGEQGDDWRAKSVELQPFSKQFQLFFEGSIGFGVPYGDIAIDDISIIRQPCKGHTQESQCTFDVAGDWCGYTQSSKNDWNWEWYNDQHTVGNKPINSTGGRSYVYITTTEPMELTNEEKISQLTSRTIDGRSSQHCVELDYAFSQNTSSKLTIAVRRNDGKQFNVLTLFGSEEKADWQHAAKTLNKEEVGERFQIVFIGILRDSNSVIGLDNPTVSLGSCDEVTNESSSKTTSSHSNSPVALFFGLLSAVLLVVVIFFAVTYLRKHKDLMPAFAVRYKVHHENSCTNGKPALSKSMSIDNPVYSPEPAVLQTTVIPVSEVIVDTT